MISSFLLSCSILLNAYGTPTECFEWIRNIGRVSEQKNESVRSCPATIKECKGHNTRGRDANLYPYLLMLQLLFYKKLHGDPNESLRRSRYSAFELPKYYG